MSQKLVKESNINKTFNNKSVLITGVTGLVGKLLLYKILISVESVKNIYVLIRSKKEKSASERLEQMIERSYGMFSDVEEEKLKKLIPIEGDISSIGLGLTDSDRNDIINNVSIVFHSAADVTFDKDIRKHLISNVGGTKEMIDLCRQLKMLNVFVYASTTYSNPLQMVTEEKIYEPHGNAIDLLELARTPDCNLNTKEIIGDFPNTYTFTKHLAESLVKAEFEKGGFPVTIVRPGIVSPSYREPYRGYFGSITSLAGGAIMIGSGLARVAKANLDITADAIPVDIVANTCIAAAWNTMTKYQSELLVYNCNSACMGAPKLGPSFELIKEFCEEYPIKMTIRQINVYVPRTTFIPLFLLRFFCETCFAYFLDFGLLLIGKKRFVVRFMKTFQRLIDACEVFNGKQWYFTNSNYIKLSQELIGVDKNTFDCDVRAVDWARYAIDTYFTSRKFIFKETDRDLPIAQRRYKLLKTGYTIMNHLLLYIILRIIFSITQIDLLISNYLNHFGFQTNEEMVNLPVIFLLGSSAFIRIVSYFFAKQKFAKYLN